MAAVLLQAFFILTGLVKAIDHTVDPHEGKEWFHSLITKEQAYNLLMAGRTEMCFIISEKTLTMKLVSKSTELAVTLCVRAIPLLGITFFIFIREPAFNASRFIGRIITSLRWVDDLMTGGYCSSHNLTTDSPFELYFLNLL